jgi:hypothetical protein
MSETTIAIENYCYAVGLTSWWETEPGVYDGMKVRGQNGNIPHTACSLVWDGHKFTRIIPESSYYSSSDGSNTNENESDINKREHDNDNGCLWKTKKEEVPDLKIVESEAGRKERQIVLSSTSNYDKAKMTDKKTKMTDTKMKMTVNVKRMRLTRELKGLRDTEQWVSRLKEE